MSRVEVVSSYFGYKEEYVLNKTPFWLNRKFEQADRERYEDRMGMAQNVFRGINLVFDLMFNKGKGVSEIMPSYDEMKKRLETEQKSEKENEFKRELWWKPGTE